MEWLKKTKNAFSKCVLEFNFAPISGPYFFFFQKKSKSMYPTVHDINVSKIILIGVCIGNKLLKSYCTALSEKKTIMPYTVKNGAAIPSHTSERPWVSWNISNPLGPRNKIYNLIIYSS
jgi:hypothetical protein